MISTEDPRDELERRIAATCANHRLTEEDIGAERLFVDSGRDQGLCTAIQTRDGTQVLQPVTDALVAELLARRIDVLIIDPLISSHAVGENDNAAIDKVVKEWGRVAERANCAIELVHHTRKLNGGEVRAEDSRGGSAAIDAVREARTLNRMTKEQADSYGVEGHRLYFRAYSDKANFAPPPDDSEWYRLVSVALANGDHVGAAERWYPPDAMHGVTVDDLKAVQRRVAEAKWREDHRSTAWVGRAVAEVLDLGPGDQAARKQIKTLLRTWTANGMFRTAEKLDGQHKPRRFVEVAEWA